jgi:transposase
MLSEVDYQEAVRRYKNMKVSGHERQRYHALILVHQGYSYREVGQILLVDEETISRWVRQYQERGWSGTRIPVKGGSRREALLG